MALIKKQKTNALLNDCTFFNLGTGNRMYAVVPELMLQPVAYFTCAHCAETWAKRLPIKHTLLSFNLSSDFVRDCFDKLTNGQIIHCTNDASATGALNKIKRNG